MILNSLPLQYCPGNKHQAHKVHLTFSLIKAISTRAPCLRFCKLRRIHPYNGWRAPSVIHGLRVSKPETPWILQNPSTGRVQPLPWMSYLKWTNEPAGRPHSSMVRRSLRLRLQRPPGSLRCARGLSLGDERRRRSSRLPSFQFLPCEEEEEELADYWCSIEQTFLFHRTAFMVRVTDPLLCLAFSWLSHVFLMSVCLEAMRGNRKTARAVKDLFLLCAIALWPVFGWRANHAVGPSPSIHFTFDDHVVPSALELSLVEKDGQSIQWRAHRPANPWAWDTNVGEAQNLAHVQEILRARRQRLILSCDYGKYHRPALGGQRQDDCYSCCAMRLDLFAPSNW